MEEILSKGPFSLDECVRVHVYSVADDENHKYLRIPSMRLIIRADKFPFVLSPLVLEERYNVYETKHYIVLIPKIYVRHQLTCATVWYSHRFYILKNQKYNCYGFRASDCVVLKPDDKGYFDIDPVLRIQFQE